MAKRENNYARTESRADFQLMEDVADSLDYLETQGKLPKGRVLKPSMINTRCITYYNRIIDIDDYIVTHIDSDCTLLRLEKSELQGKIINLISIVIGSVIKRFKSLYPKFYEDVFTECVVDVLHKIKKNQYNPEKSSFHSYCYETSYQACVKYIDKKATYENSVVPLTIN